MPSNDKQKWHGADQSDNEDLTLRHPGPHFQAIRAWAEQNNVSDIFDAIALTFGFTENFTIVSNLYRELSNPDSKAILHQWADNPYVSHLNRLLFSFSQDKDFANSYSGLHQGVSRNNTKNILRAAGADLKNEHFLLELIIQPQPPSDNNLLDRLRRALKIWLIVQALERTAEHDCPHDNQIQQVASALCLPGEDEKWALIDTILEMSSKACPPDHYSYSQFNLAIRHAASQLIARYSRSETRKELLLLKAIQRVAEGQLNPTRVQKTESAIQASFTSLIKASESVLDLSGSAGGPQLLAYSVSETDSADEEALHQLLLFGVNPEETPEQQKLSGRSILMQTAELSNYLPWSWEKPLPPEAHQLDQWINCTLADDRPEDKLGAALVWLAVHLERSLEFIQEIEITDDLRDEWSISQDLVTAHRERPRRHSSWLSDADAQPLIEPFQNNLRVTLPEQIQSILREATHAFPDIATLRQLWARASPHALTTWFRQHAKRHFPRLTSAKLANAQSQSVFEETCDHSLARLLSAHPRAALPAACGYANWSIAQVQNGFGLPLQNPTLGDERINLLGSLLAPLESILVDGIRDATQTLLESSQRDPIIFHNHLVQYTVTALNAATGCRNLSEPFESIAHFCDHPPAVFINDKSDDGLHCGRMVPLAGGANRLLANYLEHLRRFRASLPDQHKDLAHRVQQVLEGNSDTLPLFFLLDSNGAWHPLNDLAVPGTELFSWPLPKNLFRHRFAQQLARMDVHPEVIDGWMGHGERGTTSYSDHSARCWREDRERYKEALDDCFDRLGFMVPLPKANYGATAFEPKQTVDTYREPDCFGQARRHTERLRARDLARSAARKELDLALDATPISDEHELNQSHIDRLAKRMITRENGMPHPQAAVRMEVLVQWLEEHSPHTRQFIRNRTLRLGTERSLVRDTCPKALQTMPNLERWAQDTKQAIRQARLSKSDSLALATAFVAIEKRISYLGLLEDLVQGKNFRVIQHKQRVYVEYSESLEPDNYNQPVQRHQIDHTTGRLLAKGLGIKDSKDLDTAPCPKSLQSLATIMAATRHPDDGKRNERSVGTLLKELSRLIEQANLIDLPGMVAGALSNRNAPTSLCLYDYFRLTEGQRYQPPESAPAQSLPETENLPPIPASASGTYPEPFYDSAKTFLGGLQDILNQYTKAKSREIAKQVEQHCRAHNHSVSSAVLLLGYWVAHRIQKGKGRANHAHKAYAAGSIKRYLGELSGPFRGFAYKADLLLMAEEDVTELCAKMLSHCTEKLKDLPYFSARLIDFFNWASERGVSSPDWDELDLGSARRSVRPRLFSESEYLQALQLLLRPDTEDIERGMQAAFVLLLGFRFGLRAQEAIGLLRSDWCESAGLTWVLVQSNSIRSLKSSVHSRRAVPLVFQLSAVERSLVTSILTRYTTRLGNADNKPILADKEGNLTPFAGSIPSYIARTLKLVTGNTRMSLHQARHGFCNVLSSALFEIDTPLAQKLTESVDNENLRKILLGNHGLSSRRGSMAIARALGHHSPRTQFRSYNRMMTEWADRLTPVTTHYASTISKAVQIDRWPVESAAEAESAAPTIFAQPTKLTSLIVMEALRLMALGYAAHGIEPMLHLPPGELADVEVLVDRINAGLRFKVYDPEQMKKAFVYGTKLPKYLLKSRPAGVWPRLLHMCDELHNCEELDTDRPLPSLAQASNLVGRNGHLLMNEVEDAHLMRLLVDAFKIPENSYKVVIKSKPDYAPRAQRVVLAGDFVPAAASLQLDTFNEDYDKGYTRARSYAGLVLTSPMITQIHDRLELVLLYIAIASVYCPKPAPLTPLPPYPN